MENIKKGLPVNLKLRLRPDLHRRIKFLAAGRGTSLNAELCRLLERGMDFDALVARGVIGPVAAVPSALDITSMDAEAHT